MKKIILIFVLIFALGIMSGCGKTENNKPGKTPENTVNPSTDTAAEYATERFEAEVIYVEEPLLLRHLFPFDGAQGVSHQTYTRK